MSTLNPESLQDDAKSATADADTRTEESTKGFRAKPSGQAPKIGYGDYIRFRDLILERSGLYFPDKKRGDLEAGLRKALAKAMLRPVDGEPKLNAYYRLLRDKTDPGGRVEMDRLIRALTVSETYFFRDEAQFKALATSVLPSIIARKRAEAAAAGPTVQPYLRIWSAGCASGEEPYSLAILLTELLSDLENWRILILATDINKDTLARARQAVYSEWSFREAQARATRPHYFTQQPAAGRDNQAATGQSTGPVRYRLRDEIRKMVTFAPLNLIEDTYPSAQSDTLNMDLILCRNVTIYFSQEATRQVVARLYQALVDGGWLVVGHSEPSLETYRVFQARSFPDTVLYQKSSQAWSGPNEHQNSLAVGQEPVKRSHPSYTNAAGAMDSGQEMGVADHDPALSHRRAISPGVQAGRIDSQPPAGILDAPGFSSVEVSKDKSGIEPEPASDAVASLSLTRSDSYETARGLLNQGHIEEAIEELHRKLASKPDFAPAHTLLGRAYANLARWTEAQYWCQSALELDSLQAEAYYILALIHQNDGQIDSAITLFKKAIYLEREAPLPHFNLAMLYRKEGQIKNSRRFLQNTIRILEKWPPNQILADTGGMTVKRLLASARRVLDELKLEN